MTGCDDFQILLFYSPAVISDFHTVYSAVLYLYYYLISSRVEGVIQEFSQYAFRSLYDLAGCDPCGDLC